jgi:hypothetical protein
LKKLRTILLKKWYRKKKFLLKTTSKQVAQRTQTPPEDEGQWRCTSAHPEQGEAEEKQRQCSTTSCPLSNFRCRNARLDRPLVVVRVRAIDRLGGSAKLRLGNRAAPAGFGVVLAGT